MKRKLTLLFALLAFAAVGNAQKYVGGDISLLKAYEDHNAPYYDSTGTKKIDFLPYVKDNCGMNTMRVRLFHNPANASTDAKGQGAIQNLEYVKALGKQIKDNGLNFMLDFHYSDTWADPSKQWTPKAWLNITDAALLDSIYNYTKASLKALKDAGATPDFIQIGNEISYGMLWGAEGSTTYKYYAGQSRNRDRFTNLLKSASKACREVCPDAKIIIHTERIAQPSYIVSFYKDMDNAGVDYDIIGTSYYSYYHGYLSQLETALKQIEQNFKKDIMLVEVGYFNQWQPTDGTVKYDYSSTYPVTPVGQKEYTKALIDVLNKHPQVKGLLWWEMDANDGAGNAWTSQHVLTGWYNAGLVDNATGKLLPAAYVMKDFINTPTGIESIKGATANQKSAGNIWYNLNGQRVSRPDKKGIYIRNGRKVLVK